ncbi:MAG: sigma-70 family RNA polymerase sigma factor [Pirellulales bacterium]
MDRQILAATKNWTLVQPVVSAFVGAIVRDFSVRDDLLQEIAVAVLQSYEQYDPTLPFQAWALGIARNQVRNYLRQKSRDRLVFDDQTIECLVDSFANNSLRYASQLDHLHNCVGKLDEKARHILSLRYIDDLKPAAIAARISQSANSVAKALQRIRDLLRECIRREAALEELR